MNYIYLITPFFAWLICGCIKFFLNSLKAREFAITQIGYGGMPSNHSAIVSSMVSLIFFKEGINNPAFGVALTLAFIVILDANSLRKKIGEHAQEINNINNYKGKILRERIGHSRLEILIGCLIGTTISYIVIYFDIHKLLS